MFVLLRKNIENFISYCHEVNDNNEPPSIIHTRHPEISVLMISQKLYHHHSSKDLTISQLNAYQILKNFNQELRLNFLQLILIHIQRLNPPIPIILKLIQNPWRGNKNHIPIVQVSYTEFHRKRYVLWNKILNNKYGTEKFDEVGT